MGDFDVVLIAVDDYPDPPGRLAASESATHFGSVLKAGGGRVLDSVVVAKEQDFLDAVRRWADRDANTASVVYLTGHGKGNGLVHEFLLPREGGVVRYRTNGLAQVLQDDWQRRRSDPASWTLLVLDCCDSEIGVANVVNEITAQYPMMPKRLALWPVAPGGGARTGAFVAAFERALGTFTENDTVIRLHDVFLRIRRELGDLEPAGFLPEQACLTRLTPATPVVMPLDVRAELLRAIEGQPPDIRNHYLAKAQGSEVGEVAWHFTGRAAEVAQLCTWLAGDDAMKVVTGEAGSGKSALLGHLVVLADPLLVSLYAQSGLAPDLANGPRPPDNVFRAIVHLTGKTAAEAIRDIAAQVFPGWVDDGKPMAFVVAALFAGDTAEFANIARGLGVSSAPILVDALDESQEPTEIAAFLHDMAERGVLRVLVGTRRSTTEGPDQPNNPSRRDLLDALQVDDADLLVVEHDRHAVRDYVYKRLTREGSPYHALPRVAAVLAARVAMLDQPFLFARLATVELSARDPRLPTDPYLEEMLGGGHRGLFAFAMSRIGATDRGVYEMVRALAHARGRGLPRNDGIWVDVARAVSREEDATEDSIAVLGEIAGPYITLDGEAGQSTYRLAHQTFVEHFHARDDYAQGHRRIAAALTARNRERGWAAANQYAVRYVPEHLVADADQTPPDHDGLVDLVTDPGWLVRAVEILGVDRTVEVTAAARRTSPSAPVVAVERTLRRSRVALTRDPGQLPGQVHARLKDEPGPALANLGAACGEVAGRPWLRVVQGRLDWRSDIEASYTTGGKLRGLAFGQVGDRPLVAIAIDNRIVLWDPRQGAPDEAGVIDLGAKRATAVAFAVVDGRAVVVTSAAYDLTTDVWDVRTGEHLASAPYGLGHSIAVGTVGERLVVGGVPRGGQVMLLDARALDPISSGTALHGRDIAAFAVRQGALVALSIDFAPSGVSIAAVDVATGETVWRSREVTAEQPIRIAAGGDVGVDFLAVAGIGQQAVWLTRREGYPNAPVHGPGLRAVAVGSVDGRYVVASAPDFDGTVLVELHEVVLEKASAGELLYRPRTVGQLMPRVQERGPILPDELAPPPWGQRVTTFSLDRPEEWPHTASARGVLDGKPVLVTGSVEGAVWLWDESGGHVRAIAGPFTTVSPYTLDNGWEALYTKPGVPTAASVAFANHPELGPIVAVACNGKVRLFTVPDGVPIESAAEAAQVVDAVALGRVGDRDVLVTGSKGGGLGVWGVSPPERIAVLTLDTPIALVRIQDDGTIAVDPDAASGVGIRLVEP